MNTKQNLEHSYKTFIDREHHFDFFKGLAEYLEYLFSVPTLKEELDKQMAERRVLIKQIEDAEKKTREELNQAKAKLLALVKKGKVDIASLNRYQTWVFNGNTNILEELESFEKGRSVGSVFISDEIGRFLFDIAANLFNAGYEKELNEFIVSPQEYATYYRRINGSNQYISENQCGNFVFSKTWPERWEKVGNFERERVLKLWGSFEALLQFDTAYKFATSKNINLTLTPPSGTENTPWFGGAKERVKIFSMAQEMQRLTENRMDFFSRVAQDYGTRQNDELKNLKHIDLKTATETVHNRLLIVAGEGKIAQDKPAPFFGIPTPLKVEIVALPEKKENREHKFPHKLPAGTIWENFTIKFLNDENIFIQVKQFKHATSYKEMGFVGKGNNPNPSEAWTFLKVLARVNGKLTLKDPETRDKYKKQKELLAKSLQGYFSLDYDPFYPYRSSSEKSGNSYKIKITLVSPPAKNEQADVQDNKDDLGLKDYLDKQAPLVYDE